MTTEKLMKIAESHLVKAMDAAGKELMTNGEDLHACEAALATQLLLQARWMLRMAGGAEFEASTLYAHADEAALSVAKRNL